MESKEQQELIEKLLKIDFEPFKLAGEIFVHTGIKFVRAPVFTPTIFNINLIKELNTAQLQFLFSIINEELEKREDT